MATKKIFLEEGQILPTRKYGDIVVLYHNNSRDVGIKFLSTGYKRSNIQVGNLIRGTVVDHSVPSVFGMGFINTERSVATTKCYMYWHGMLERAYSTAYHKTRPSYKDVEVCKEWLDFTKFEQWFNTQKMYKGYHLDKDLLGNGKLYSPETCCFVPQEINAIITDNESKRGDCPRGVSKRKVKGQDIYNGLLTVAASGIYLGRFWCENTAHEHYVDFKTLLLEEYADKYYELGLIEERVKVALYKYSL